MLQRFRNSTSYQQALQSPMLLLLCMTVVSFSMILGTPNSAVMIQPINAIEMRRVHLRRVLNAADSCSSVQSNVVNPSIASEDQGFFSETTIIAATHVAVFFISYIVSTLISIKGQQFRELYWQKAFEIRQAKNEDNSNESNENSRESDNNTPCGPASSAEIPFAAEPDDISLAHRDLLSDPNSIPIAELVNSEDLVTVGGQPWEDTPEDAAESTESTNVSSDDGSSNSNAEHDRATPEESEDPTSTSADTVFANTSSANTTTQNFPTPQSDKALQKRQILPCSSFVLMLALILFPKLPEILANTIAVEESIYALSFGLGCGAATADVRNAVEAKVFRNSKLSLTLGGMGLICPLGLLFMHITSDLLYGKGSGLEAVKNAFGLTQRIAMVL